MIMTLGVVSAPNFGHSHNHVEIPHCCSGLYFDNDIRYVESFCELFSHVCIYCAEVSVKFIRLVLKQGCLIPYC